MVGGKKRMSHALIKYFNNVRRDFRLSFLPSVDKSCFRPSDFGDDFLAMIGR
jgi:hypothetical protein